MDFGILFGVVVALIDHVGTTTRVSSLNRVLKRSRMVWSAETYNILQLHGYSSDNEKIVTLEIKGPVFFGSSQKLLQDITEEIGLDISDKELRQIALASPHTSTPHSSIKARKPRGVNSRRRTRIHPQYVVLDMTSMHNLDASAASRLCIEVIHPQYVVLDMTSMHNLDASAASSCFLQLAKLCEKRGIFLCAAGVLPRVEWMLRSHHVAYAFDDEIKMKNDMLSHRDGQWNQPVFDKLILFMTLFEVSTSGVYCLLNCSAIVCSTNSCMTRHLSSVNDFSFEE
jgi:MFS superfamily sulfate permease-like transporter